MKVFPVRTFDFLCLREGHNGEVQRGRERRSEVDEHLAARPPLQRLVRWPSQQACSILSHLSSYSGPRKVVRSIIPRVEYCFTFFLASSGVHIKHWGGVPGSLRHTNI